MSESLWSLQLQAVQLIIIQTPKLTRQSGRPNVIGHFSMLQCEKVQAQVQVYLLYIKTYYNQM